MTGPFTFVLREFATSSRQLDGLGGNWLGHRGVALLRIFLRERDRLGEGQVAKWQSLGKVWPWSFSRSFCPLTWAEPESFQVVGRGVKGGRRRCRDCSLLFPSSGGSKTRDSSITCLCRNKAMRRPTMAPTTSYSSSIATVSAPSSVSKCHPGPFKECS